VKWTIKFFFILMSIALIACQKNLPEPETKNRVVSAAQLPYDVVSVKGESFRVKSFVKGNDVFIECIVSNFSFRDDDKKGSRLGKMIVYVDGQKYNQYSSAAFIVKDLKSGNHRISLQIVDSNGHTTSLKKEMVVSIP
jgi:hypothetical protein